ncbi:MAG: polyphenol oxidase family protein [Deferribacteraceae bacterium]|jgi:YfiH family protein|nr:polyphenol oxidase family protein [Deferribacteraceae bacterium]
MKIVRAYNAPTNVSIFMTTAEATFDRYSADSRPVYEALCAAEGLISIVTLHQVHSANVFRVSAANQLAVNDSDGDGLFTSEAGLAIGVRAADCYPVAIVGEHSIATVHCGWRGAVNGIINSAARLFQAEGDKPQYAYVGAGISCEAFEVKEDFIAEVSKLTNSAPYLVNNDGWHFDLKKFIVDRLRDIDVANIETADRCTFADPSFHSYRRDGAAAGRMLMVAYARR